MSESGDTELRDLVCQILAGKGVLGAIKAEIRANVFHVLNNQKHICQTDPQLTEFSKTKKGAVILSLVRELLEIFKLKYTLTVFDAETNNGQDYTFHDRSAIMKELNLKDTTGDHGTNPVLLYIFNKFVWSDKFSDDITPTHHETKQIEGHNQNTKAINPHRLLSDPERLVENIDKAPENVSVKKTLVEEWLESCTPENSDRNSSPDVDNYSLRKDKSMKCDKTFIAGLPNDDNGHLETALDSTDIAATPLSSLKNLPPVINTDTKKNQISEIMEIMNLGIGENSENDNFDQNGISNIFARNVPGEATNEDFNNIVSSTPMEPRENGILNDVSATAGENEKDERDSASVYNDTVSNQMDKDDVDAASVYHDVLDLADKDDRNDVCFYSDTASNHSGENNVVLSDGSDKNDKDKLSSHSSLSDKNSTCNFYRSNIKSDQQNEDKSSSQTRSVSVKLGGDDKDTRSTITCGTSEGRKENGSGDFWCHSDVPNSYSNENKDDDRKRNIASQSAVDGNSVFSSDIGNSGEKVLEFQLDQNSKFQNEDKNVKDSVVLSSAKDNKNMTDESDIEEDLSFDFEISEVSKGDVSTCEATVSDLNEIKEDYGEDL